MELIHQTHILFAAAAALVLVGVASSLIARRFGAPLLLVFLAIGMLAGVDGPGGIGFHDYDTTYRIGSFALAVILFDGGLRTHRESFKGVVAPTLLLATAGVAISAFLTGMVARTLLDLSTGQGLLLGAVVASTDAAAVFFLLRAGGLQLRTRVGSTLEIESSANDPVAVLLTTLIAGWLAAPHAHDISGFAVVADLAFEFALGAILGALGGFAIVLALRRLPLSGGLAALFLLSGAIFLFGTTGALHASGFLAVYVAGVVIGNRRVPGFTNLLSVLDASTWLCQSVMFLVLGLLAAPHRMAETIWPAFGIAAFLMLVGRPLAVFACTAPFGYTMREIGFISWVGLRGAVGIFLALIPIIMKLESATLIFNVAFVVVVASLTVQGWTLGLAARVFKVALPHRERTVRRVELDLPGTLERELVGYPVAADARIIATENELPGWAQLTMLVREGKILAPKEAGAPLPGDYAYLLAPPGAKYRLDWLFVPADEATAAERDVFGEFSFAADVMLGDIASFYDIPVGEADAAMSLAEHFSREYEYTVEVGDTVRLGAVTLVARELSDQSVSKVGLKFQGVRGVLAQSQKLRESRLAGWIARHTSRSRP